MSLSQTRHLFGGISETGIDHFLAVFFKARPHLLAYGTPAFAGNQDLVTRIDTTSLPFFLSGLQALIRFDIPTVDITPAASPSELLAPGPNQFTLRTVALIRFQCGSPRGEDRQAHEIDMKLDLAVLCSPIVVNSAPGVGSIGISLVNLQIVGIGPAGLEQILECILSALLRWALAQAIIPFRVFTLDGVSLTLQEGPTAADNQIEVRGDIS